MEDPPPTLPGIDDPPQTDRPVPGTGLAVTRLLGSHLFLDPYNVRPPFDSVQLVNITPITMVYGTQITIVTGANLNQLITGGPHIVEIPPFPTKKVSSHQAGITVVILPLVGGRPTG